MDALQSQETFHLALRQLPEAHSLALRLEAAGVAPDIICEYLHIEPEGLPMLLMVARQKLAAQVAAVAVEPNCPE